MGLTKTIQTFLKTDKMTDILTVVAIILVCCMLAATISLDAADFAHNQPKESFVNGDMTQPLICHPSCCPSQWSCSNGCVCMTSTDKWQMRTRGGNSSKNDF